MKLFIADSPEAMIAVNQDGRILALEFENTRIKEELAAAPDQQELQALKEKLEIAQRSKESYEVSGRGRIFGDSGADRGAGRKLGRAENDGGREGRGEKCLPLSPPPSLSARPTIALESPRLPWARLKGIFLLTFSLPSSKSTFSQTFKREMYK